MKKELKRKRSIVWKKIWSKIAAIAIVAMFVGSGVFGIVDAVEEDSSNWGEPATEEITMYVESLLEKDPWNKNYDSDILPSQQMPKNRGSRPLVYEPPWDDDRWTEEKNVAGFADAGYDSVETTSNYGLVDDMFASAGVGYGEADMTIWLTHGFWFSPPITDTYTFTFEYSIEGFAFGVCYSEVGDAGDYNLVKVFCMVGYEVEDEVVFYREGYHEEDIDWSGTITMSVDLTKGYSYYVAGQAGLKSEAWSILGIGATAHMGNPQDIQARLEKVTIDWPNHIPEQPSKPDGPSQGITGEEYTFTTSATDPDGIGDSLWYKWFWGDGTESEWIGPYESGEECSASHSWAEKGTYQIRVYAKDRDDAVSPPSDPKSIIISDNQPPGKPQRPSGETNGHVDVTYTYTTSTTDPEGQQIYYKWDWGDGQSDWLGPYDSGSTASASHLWSNADTYYVKVKAKDTEGAESSWSDPLAVYIDTNSQPASIEISWPKIGHLNIAGQISIPIPFLQSLGWGIITISNFIIRTEATGSIDYVTFQAKPVVGSGYTQTDYSYPFTANWGDNLPTAFAYKITATAYYNGNQVAQDIKNPFVYTNIID